MGENILTTFTGALTGFATAVPTAVVNAFDTLFVSGDGISNLAIWGITFLAGGIVLGLSKAFTAKLG